ncbi:MAG: DUF2147 domain-containing protein [Boseongicola sp.]|nr:DUF2147 domain-containing protein [Boseongicola sp.]MDD9978823.1 DUF2147 domain-containing protein [Boseongicola sp.]
MKRLIAAAALACLGTTAFAADPVVGMYKTQPGDEGNFAHVEIYECDGSICGVMRKAFDASGTSIKSDAIGKRMIWDMASKGNGKYSGGKIWAPDRDKVYKSKMKLEGSTLSVSGCVAVICRSQSWTRVK